MVDRLLAKKVDRWRSLIQGAVTQESKKIGSRVCLGFVCLFLIAGVFRTTVNADPTQLVSSQSERYATYKSLLKKFPGEDDQILIFTEAPVFDVVHLNAYRIVQKPLLDLPQVLSVGSLFSSPLVGSSLDKIIDNPKAAKEKGTVKDVRALLQRPDFLLTRLVSENFDALLMTLTLNASADRAVAIAAIESVLTSQYSQNAGIAWSIAGNPVVEQAIKKDVMREIFRVSAFAMFLGALIAGWALRNFRAVVTVLVVPFVAVVGTIGLMGWLGIALTLLSQAVLIVVFLVVFTDTLHVLRGGRTVRSLMLACGLTSLTTSAAAVALLFASSLVIQEFGLALLAGIGVGFVVWSLWLLSTIDPTAGANGNSNSAPVVWAIDKGWPEPVLYSRKTIFVTISVVMALLVLPASQLRTGFSFSENLPRSHGAAAALTMAESRFAGYLPLQVGLTKQDKSLTTSEFIQRIGSLQQSLNSADSAALASVQRWYSIVDVLALVPGFSDKQRLASLPYTVRRSLWRQDGEAVIVAPHSVQQLLATSPGYLAELDQQIQTLANKESLDASLVTGLPALIREASTELLSDAWRSIWLTLVVLAILVGVVLRSWRLAFLAAMPVAFSVVGLAASLVLLGEPLRHIGVVLMTIVIGLSVDNALHLIVSVKDGATSAKAALQQCLPVLWISTMTIVAGFIALICSDIPSLATSGLATATSLVIGFIASVLWIPPFLNTRQSRSKKEF